MSDNVTLVKIVSEGLTFSNAVYSMIFLFAGAVVVIIGLATKKGRRFFFSAGGGLVGIGAVSAFVNSPELRNILTAFASVSAAIFAAYSIDQTRAIREDTRKQQARDVKEKRLNLIIEWAMGVARYGFEPGIADTHNMSKVEFAQFVRGHEQNLRHFRLARAESLYMVDMAARLDPGLKDKVISLTDVLRVDFIRELFNHLRSMDAVDEQGMRLFADRLSGNAEKPYGIATEVVEKAASLMPDVDTKTTSRSHRDPRV